MSAIENIRQFIRDQAKLFGAEIDNGIKKSFVERNNTGSDALLDKGAYFGFIHPEEENSGPYHDFSIVIMPSEDSKPWLVCLGVGSRGFKNDYELASYPGVRRLFSKLINEQGFCKSDFTDIETNLPKHITNNTSLQHLKKTISTYSKVISACQIIESPESDEGKKKIAAFVAAYAKLRDWPTNNMHRDNLHNTLTPFIDSIVIDDEVEVLNLVKNRRFVILQGPPGTGKTFLAKKVAAQLSASIFFTQFHAETTYSDFIYGIRPDTQSGQLSYKESHGTFTLALEHALANRGKNVVLIIDEINRANLSNVLGPLFYLFEHKMNDNTLEVAITPSLSISTLPSNFYVLATMNTADRSLAVIDFALRRRFAWYDLKPKTINESSFRKNDFIKIQEIFEWYASPNELSLQPGQGYFLADSDDEMKNRIRYELLPLIKEYLNEGLLRNAQEELNNYFLNRINLALFE